MPSIKTDALVWGCVQDAAEDDGDRNFYQVFTVVHVRTAVAV